MRAVIRSFSQRFSIHRKSRATYSFLKNRSGSLTGQEYPRDCRRPATTLSRGNTDRASQSAFQNQCPRFRGIYSNSQSAPAARSSNSKGSRSRTENRKSLRVVRGASVPLPKSRRGARAGLGPFRDCPGRGAVPAAQTENEPDTQTHKAHTTRKMEAAAVARI